MPKASPIQTAFNAGEWGPLLEGRVDLSKYFLSCRTLENFVCLTQGPAVKRSGTRFVAEVKDSSKATRLLPFEFNVEQAYIIEVGDQYMRFYRNEGRIESPPGTPVEIATPYLEADLFQLKFAQSADILYITHKDYEPRKLSRTSHTAWTLTVIDFKDGPYLPINLETADTLTPSATTGSGITITAGGAHTPFASTDVGRPVRMLHSGTWGYAEITAFGSSTSVTADVKSDFGGTTATENWRLGLWSDTTGYPAAVTFFEDRLTFGGGKEYPLRLDGSFTGDYENFAPSDTDGTVRDDDAIAFTLNANNVNAIQWLVDDEKGLFAGTVGGEWTLRSGTDAISAVNPPQATRSTTYGSANVMPVKAGRSTLFLQRANREVRELAFVFEDDGFRAPEMTLLANHIGDPGIVELSYQQEPHSTVWAPRSDGVLLGMTFEREQDVVGWHRHILGGYSDSGKTTAAKVEAVASIPKGSGVDCECDQPWFIVNRYIDGGTKRYVEFLEGYWKDSFDQEDAFYVDSGLTYDGVATTTLTGLDHLEGETVTIFADGATHPDKTVSGGSVTLERSVTVAQVGLAYTATLVTNRIEAGAADGTAQGKTKRIHRVTFRVHQTFGGKAGPDTDNTDPIPELDFRSSTVPMDSPPSLMDIDAHISWPGGYEEPGRIAFVHDLPFPAQVLAVMPQLVTQDR